MSDSAKHASPPYPGYPPSYQVVQTLGSWQRTCLVLELLSQAPLTAADLALVQERLEGLLAKVTLLEKTRVILPASFDTLLRAGLRLP